MRRIIIFISIFYLAMITGCHTGSNQLSTNYIATAEVNPDIHHNPSPIVVTTYQLKSIDAFKHADYFSLYDHAKTILGQDLLHQEQIEIKPEQQLVITQRLLPQTHYIGVIAAYRDIDNATWREIIRVKDIKSQKVTIQLQNNKMVMKS